MKLILTHEHADFDALASLLAAARLHEDAVPVLPRTLNRNLSDFLALYRDEFPFVANDRVPPGHIHQLILVDTQTFAAPRRIPAATPVQIIDHHALSRELEPHWRYWGGAVGATTTLLVEQMSERGLTLKPLEATLLLLGIYEDTGSLTYVSTTPRDLRCAAWLLEHGANLNVANCSLRHPLSEAQWALYQQLARRSRPFEYNGQSIIIAQADAPDYVDEISTLAHKLRDVFEPSALFILVSLGAHIQMVARSSADAVDVGQIADALGGGGHARAAAAVLQGTTLDAAAERIRELLRQHVKPPLTVAQIMSYGVQTLTPETTVAEAAQRMQRYGHEGFPVVEDGRIVGMLTRREIDRALHHGLERTPIRRYMTPGQVFVRPDEPVSRVQQVMTEQGWGQIPVVDADGRILGIVTRTDLIKLWGNGPARPAAASDLSPRLAEALPPAMLRLLREVGQAADAMGYPLYVVGGFVRDLLLGTPTLDLDLVVEGDGIRLAQTLAETHGGDIRSHQRFGTAKWLLDDATMQRFGLDALRSLDFVTARTEFYERPTALPTVEQSSIKLDLHRRDFTINTLAIRLNPSHWGELSDFYNGRRDLEQGLIRVLHSLSFVEDPTRILRAVRLETRLRFTIEPRTAELIGGALDLLERVSGDRLRHELYLIFQEAEPGRALQRLDDLGVLRRIHPRLTGNGWLAERFAALRAAWLQDGAWPTPAQHLALWLYRLDDAANAAALERLHTPKADADVVEDARRLRQRQGALAQNDLRPSQIVTLLDDVSGEARQVFATATDSWLARQRIAQYEGQWRDVQPALDGNDLRQLGLRPGPIYRELLARLRAARLDGEVATRQDEEQWVRGWLAEAEQAAATVQD